jgi:hypothetical protein
MIIVIIIEEGRTPWYRTKGCTKGRTPWYCTKGRTTHDITQEHLILHHASQNPCYTSLALQTNPCHDLHIANHNWPSNAINADAIRSNIINLITIQETTRYDQEIEVYLTLTQRNKYFRNTTLKALTSKEETIIPLTNNKSLFLEQTCQAVLEAYQLTCQRTNWNNQPWTLFKIGSVKQRTPTMSYLSKEAQSKKRRNPFSIIEQTSQWHKNSNHPKRNTMDIMLHEQHLWNITFNHHLFLSWKEERTQIKAILQTLIMEVTIQSVTRVPNLLEDYNPTKDSWKLE